MLKENTPLPEVKRGRLIMPEDIVPQIPFNKMEGVVVLSLMPDGQPNRIWLSSVTVQELAFIAQQLQAHVNYILTGQNGQPPLEEGF